MTHVCNQELDSCIVGEREIKMYHTMNNDKRDMQYKLFHGQPRGDKFYS